MNDKIKQLFENAEQSDSMAKLKWRIENREQLRQQRKKELMELIERDKKDPIEWLEQEMLKGNLSMKEILEQAKVMYKAQSQITENTSDGYHTFKTLYAIRKAYNVALFNEWGRIVETIDPYGRRFGMYEELVEDNHVADKYFLNALSSKIKSMPKNYVHKSRRHHDGEFPFGKDDWFIVCAMLPTGQISNHYPIEDWDLFQIPETEKALFKFDGHTTDDVINRLINLNK
jgi:transcriptional regulator with XRE-family HTH domain